MLQYAKLLDHAVASARSELDFLAAIVNEIPDAVAIFDPQDQLLLSNQKLKQLIGAHKLDAGIELHELAQHLHLPNQVLKNTSTPLVQRINTLQGSQEFFLKVTSIESPAGGQLRLVILTDITELRQSQTQRDRALQFLSHDMRTPIASILSLTRRSTQAQEPIEQREKIVHHAKALLNMMDDFILTISAEAPLYQFKQELLDNLLNDAIEQVTDLADAKSIRLHDHSHDTTIFVMANTRLLVRAMVNLLFNAVKFSAPNSVIDIYVTHTTAHESQAAKVTLTIHNHVDNTTPPSDLTPSMPGFGLGLDFVDTVIHKHQGTITRDIPAHGQATVSVRLPCTDN